MINYSNRVPTYNTLIHHNIIIIGRKNCPLSDIIEATPCEYVFHRLLNRGMYIINYNIKVEEWFFPCPVVQDAPASQHSLFTLNKHIVKKYIYIPIVIIVVRCKSESIYYIRPNRFPFGLRLLISTVRLRLSVELGEETV